MNLTLRKWDNSLVLRIPAVEAERLGWEEGTVLEAENLPRGLKLESADSDSDWIDEFAQRRSATSFWGSASSGVTAEAWG